MSLRSRDLPIEERWGEFWRSYYAGHWEPETRTLIRATLKPGDLFLDIGAWIGPLTLWALEWGAEVIAIEPDPVAAAELKRIMPREIPSRVEVWEGALTTGSEFAQLGSRGEYGDSMSRLGQDGVRVYAWTLEEVLHGRSPALAVMDVEGYELDLLPTVAPALAALGCTLQVALHDALPDPAWFADFSEVTMPPAARTRGRSNNVIARP